MDVQAAVGNYANALKLCENLEKAHQAAGMPPPRSRTSIAWLVPGSRSHLWGLTTCCPDHSPRCGADAVKLVWICGRRTHHAGGAVNPAGASVPVKGGANRQHTRSEAAPTEEGERV